MRFLQERGIAILGCAQTKLVRGSGRSALSLMGEAADALMRDTGLKREDVDGLATTLAMSEAGNPFYSNLVCETLGLSVRWCQVTDIGGSSSIGNIARAAAAIHAGMANVVLCVAADAPTTRELSVQRGHRTEFYDPMGYAGPLTTFGLLSSRYDHLWGLPHDALAKLAVTQRSGALLNEYACDVLRRPLTAQDYLDSKVVSDPLRILDCVMRCDGAFAFLVTTTKFARAMGARAMIHPISYQERVNSNPTYSGDDITRSGFEEVGPSALESAGLKAADIRMLHAYDDFLIALILQLEQIGFCNAGEGGAFVMANDLGPRGTLPLNCGGGQISAGQPGLAGGAVNLAEAVYQLMGRAGQRQVPDASNAMVTGIGVIQYGRNWGTSNVMVLERSA